MKIPQFGQTKEDVLNTMRTLRDHDADWKSGKTWSLVYYAGEDILDLLQKAYTLFFSENGLNPMAFPSLQKFESEVIAMTAELLGGGSETVGNMTSGGTDSILMAVKTARDRARAEHPEISAPEMIIPSSAHAAFDKAAQYFDVKAVRIPLDSDFRADVSAMGAAITPDTILMVGSAPAYPQGVVDPIKELAALAQAHNIAFHVDSCLGGFLLPFVRKLGYPVPDFDLSVPGVTSLSVDIHKYGYAAKGASVILYHDKDFRKYQYTITTDWSGGIYASPTSAGTRPGGAIAAAWAIMNHLGEEGYLNLAAKIMQTTQNLIQGIRAIPDLQVLGEPTMSVLSFASETLDLYAVADVMNERGWHLDRQQYPTSLHLMVTPAHTDVTTMFLHDLEEATAIVRSGAASPAQGTAAMYGMLAQMTESGMAKAFIQELMDQLTHVQ